MRVTREVLTLVLIAGSLSWESFVLGSDRPAAEILDEIDTIHKAAKDDLAKMDPARRAAIREDPVARRERQEEQLRLVARRDQLVWEIYKTYPDHERVPKLLSLRWMNLARYVDPKVADRTLSEIDGVLAECKNPRLATDVAFLRAEFVLRSSLRRRDGEAFKTTMPAIEDAIRRVPRDLRGSKLLVSVLQQVELSLETRKQLEARILKDYPESPYADMVLKSRRLRESVGKPFELEFTDAIGGTKVSMKALRGKVVVIDFWATWCGPCVAEMPRMKLLYAKYRDQGVEFIGVSSDAPVEDGGLERLKAFANKNQIAWPQYYQGRVGEGSFTDNWGVYVLPTVFVVDAEGNLASVDGRGRLDQLIPALLEGKRKGM